MATRSTHLSSGEGRSSRLAGLDLLRGAAVLAVALLHSGNGKPAPGGAGFLEHFAGFAVPFFLATSFYLAVSKLYTSKTPYSLPTRLSRLLIPYGVWTAIYVLFACVKYGVSGKRGEWGEIFQDPVSILFFGSPAYHLYFIPLLLMGTVLLKGAERLIQWQLRVIPLLGLLVLSTIAYEVILVTGNGFELGPNLAMQPIFAGLGLSPQQYPLLRIASVALVWALRCLPYIALVLLWKHPSVQKRFPQVGSQPLVAGLAFLIINGLGDRILPAAIYEVAQGYSALVFALALSTVLEEKPWIRNLGLCSFGIYLMHLIWVETLKTLLGRVFPGLLTEVTILTLLTFAVPACLISWLLTVILMRRKGILPKVLFG
ncbi:hypothetical protein BST81_00240 [Leptolyngbya sp. 'hensonii']|uniref:acyltransferase family protein n=1 Tax=Leptolyngbya sp. 'hensonii' TaxID=1922337 RepID=UPI000950253B|nr:acyltransferase [Leptolyngbya sp. 'hensonii']OLP20475.1 hypothetical protein BST81_00240 [Leptolyngbya sp. 'hensonii']